MCALCVCDLCVYAPSGYMQGVCMCVHGEFGLFVHGVCDLCVVFVTCVWYIFVTCVFVLV